MKGKIFIGWSGDNDIALKVRESLEKKEYMGVVGGASRNRNGLYVGDSVLKEINHCNQALFIVQKKSDGKISNNLMFEFGYALAKFNSNKIHVFYIDIEPNDETIPTDIQGIWAEFLKTDKEVDIIDEITNKFLANQKYIITNDKMAVVNSYYKLKDFILHYSEAPLCSEYELAQYVIFFAVGAYMNSNEGETLKTLEEFYKKHYNPSKELALAVRLSLCYLETLNSIEKGEETIYLSKDSFRQAYRKISNIRDSVEDWQEDDFTLWINTITYDLLNYTLVLYASNPEIEDSRKIKYLEESIECGEICLAFCDKLLQNTTNQNFAELFKAYMYRNISTASKMLNKEPEVIQGLLSDSYKMRELLWDYYNETQRINTTILQTFEMEYFLALSEQLEYMEDDFERDDCRDDCYKYITKIECANREKSHFIHKIELNIKAIDEEDL